jgi:Icc-related predicted phosphoesterase
MQILAISDLHGDLDSARAAIRAIRPDLVVCCGDWGDAEEVSLPAWEGVLALAPVLSTFGNHDPMDLLRDARNRDGSSVLLGQGEVREVSGLRIAAIGGIWAKSHRLPHYVTDEDVSGWARAVAEQGPIDLLMTHGCPVGLADRTPSGRHGGQRCFLLAFQKVAPGLHLCGHLHVPQEHVLKDGRKVINVGATPHGSIAVIDFDRATRTLDARLESIPTGRR